MPRLIEYVKIGICSGYGDGDYQVSATVANLSVEDMQQLRLAFVYALFCAEEMWRKEQGKRMIGQEDIRGDGSKE